MSCVILVQAAPDSSPPETHLHSKLISTETHLHRNYVQSDQLGARMFRGGPTEPRECLRPDARRSLAMGVFQYTDSSLAPRSETPPQGAKKCAPN